MLRKSVLFLFPFLLLVAVATGLHAVEKITANDKKHAEQALQKLSAQVGKSFPVTGVEVTPVSNLLQVYSDAMIFYVTRDGKYVLVGDFLDLSKDKDNWNLTEVVSRKQRQQVLSQVNPEDMIVFPALGKRVASVWVFTDIDCKYCRELQANIKDYTEAGIEIKYLAFPRSGPGSASFKKAITVWCSTDKQRDLTLAKQGKELPDNFCEPNPVLSQYELAKKLGLNGTPTIILPNGVRIGGLVPAAELLKIVKQVGQ